MVGIYASHIEVILDLIPIEDTLIKLSHFCYFLDGFDDDGVQGCEEGLSLLVNHVSGLHGVDNAFVCLLQVRDHFLAYAVELAAQEGVEEFVALHCFGLGCN